MTGKTKLIDVARLAGVSVPTVDRVVNGRGSVKLSTEAKVLAAARELKLDRALDIRPTKVVRLGVVLHSRSNPYVLKLREAFQKVSKKYAHMNIQLQHFEFLNFSLEAVETTLDRAYGCDGLVVDLFQNRQLDRRLRQISKKIPIITLASDLQNCGRVAYVGSDGLKEGQIAASLIGKFIGPTGGDIILINGLEMFTNQKLNDLGFRTHLREHFPTCRIVEDFESREADEKIYSFISNCLAKYPNIRGIYNASVGNGVIAQVLVQMNKADVFVVTHTLTPKRRHLLQNGIIDVVIDRDVEDDATAAVEIFLQHIGRLETDILPRIREPMIYLRENLPD